MRDLLGQTHFRASFIVAIGVLIVLACLAPDLNHWWRVLIGLPLTVMVADISLREKR
jgi:hypothetical protein